MKTLEVAYQNRMQAALEKHRAGIPVIGYTSNTVPVELIEAAGFFPVLVDSEKEHTPRADVYMEPVFDRRTKGIFDDILAGEWSFLRALIIPRTSEAEHKLFLYLTEVKRITLGNSIPEIYFFDFLHSQKELSRAYSFRQFERLKEYLEKISESSLTSEKLQLSISLANERTEVVNQLLALRTGPSPKLTGTEAMPLIGAAYFMDKSAYIAALKTALGEIDQRPPIPVKQRILIKGFPLNNIRVHQFLEQDGTVVVAEDDWFGSRATSKPIHISENPLESIFEKYFTDTPSPRIFPAAKANEWFESETLKGIDEVIFHLPHDDDTYGWDYPLQHKFLTDHGVKSAVIRSIGELEHF